MSNPHVQFGPMKVDISADRSKNAVVLSGWAPSSYGPVTLTTRMTVAEARALANRILEVAGGVAFEEGEKRFSCTQFYESKKKVEPSNWAFHHDGSGHTEILGTSPRDPSSIDIGWTGENVFVLAPGNFPPHRWRIDRARKDVIEAWPHVEEDVKEMVSQVLLVPLTKVTVENMMFTIQRAFIRHLPDDSWKRLK
jgi:hypothetical protein